VIEFGNRLEPRLKMRVLDEKFLLKRAARSLVPAAILRRPKQPYRAPDAVAFFGASRPAAIDAVLDPANLHASGCFDPDKVARLSQKIARAVETRQPVSHRESAAWMGIDVHAGLAAAVPARVAADPEYVV
jgi:asparagine synthase (glutamine-hydrolysing)